MALFFSRIISIFLIIVMLCSSCLAPIIAKENNWVCDMRQYLREHEDVDVVRLADFTPNDRWDTVVIYFSSKTVREELEAELGFSIRRDLNNCLFGGYLLLSGKRIVRHGNFDDPIKYSDSIGIRISPQFQQNEGNPYFRVLSIENAVFYVDRPDDAYGEILLYPLSDVLEYQNAS